MSEAGRSPLTDTERAGHYIEIWKQATQVNQHFNDIEWRIRGLALTVATFSIGAAGVAARDGDTVWGISIGTLLLGVGLILWYAFYFVDLVWYHQLLGASARHTGLIEDELIGLGLSAAGLGKAISEGSPIEPPHWMARLRRSRQELRSTDKLKWFYRIGGFALLLVALGLQVYSLLVEPSPAPPPEVVVHVYRD